MILAAGFGTRLLPFTERLPKPLFPILGKTLLEMAIETAKKAGPDVIVVNAHHLADQIVEFVEDRDFGVEVAVSVEEDILGTAGGIKAAERWLSSGDFGVINSDIIAEVDWASLKSAHGKKGAMATLMLRKNPDPATYGPISTDGAGKITRFVKTSSPEHDEASPSMMFTGVSILSPAIFDRIPAGRAVDISSGIYGPIVAGGGPMYGYVSQMPWADAGTAEDYYYTVMNLLEKSGMDYGNLCAPENVAIYPPVYVAPGAILEPGCAIGPHVSVSRGAIIKSGARISGCVVLPGSEVRSGAEFSGRIV